MDELGAAFEDYRRAVYADGFSAKRSWPLNELLEFLKLASRYIKHSLAANWRDDGLFHSYNMLEFSSGDQRVGIRRLDEMLEGQVAALNSGMIGANKSLSLLTEMFNSKLFRADQRSFMLYPLRQLPGFLEKNVVPTEAVSQSPLLSAMIKVGNRSLIARDADGLHRFNGSFQNSGGVKQALARLAIDVRWKDLVAANGPAILRLYDEVFDHGSFTGRSRTMYGYEGIGCIYWHMVSKLLLAVQECFWRTVDQKVPAAEIDALADAYYRARAGLEYDKTAVEYGAFPMDPYSHTPLEGGARQPGMTGRVKEEILTRLGEWGLRVRSGEISFDPRLLRKRELLTEAISYSFVSLDGTKQSIDLESGTAAFTFCQVPIIYRAAQSGSPTNIRLWRSDGSTTLSESSMLDRRTSHEIFQRRGTIRQLEVLFSLTALRKD